MTIHQHSDRRWTPGATPGFGPHRDASPLAGRGVAEALHRVQREYEEMPGLSLTLQQARRLFGLTEELCQLVFVNLTAGGVLRRTQDGRFIVNRAAA